MVAPSSPSPQSIKAAYEGMCPECIHIANGVVRIRDRGSDGDESRLPHTHESVSHNTIDALQEADRDTVNHWLDKIGNYLVHEGSGQWHHLAENRLYRLKRFPLGYKLYTHLKGDRRNPRKDDYLYGSTTCRVFRSPEEFVLHCKWLAFGKPVDKRGRALCGCCYCSKRPRAGISAMLRAKVSHLVSHTSTSSRGSKTNQGRELSPESRVPVIAKDYTQLSRGEGVSVWVQYSDQSPPSTASEH